MQRGSRFALLACSCLFSFGLVSCGNDAPSERQTIERTILIDYGMHVSGLAIPLLGGAIIPDIISEKANGPFLAGDSVSISFSGTWVELESYPSRIVGDDLEIHSVEITHLPVVEVEVVSLGSEGTGLSPVHDTDALDTSKMSRCINADSTFQDVASYPLGTKLYAMDKDGEAFAFYSFDPLSER